MTIDGMIWYDIQVQVVVLLYQALMVYDDDYDDHDCQ
jgi:hypothetical protein